MWISLACGDSKEISIREGEGSILFSKTYKIPNHVATTNSARVKDLKERTLVTTPFLRLTT
jgi:hypothetical protein